jgi:hypothetical protein
MRDAQMWYKVELKKRSVFGPGAGGWREEANLQGAVTGRGKSASGKRVVRAGPAQSKTQIRYIFDQTLNINGAMPERSKGSD